MRYDTSKAFELERLREFIKRNTGKKLDVKVVRYKRSLSANAYLHLLCGYFASEAGYTLQEAKDIYKQVNTGIYSYTKNGRQFTRSSAELDSAEMATTIDRFRAWSAEQGIQLPSAEDKPFMEWATDQVAKYGVYL